MEIFKALTDNEKALLVDSLIEEKFENGAPIITQGAAGDSFYIIKAGSVKVTKADADGHEQLIKDKLGPSDYFGEMALLKDELRMASVTATSPTVCLKLDRKDFAQLLGARVPCSA